MNTAKGRLQLLWGAVVVQLGRALDLRWHLNHDEFEGVSQQFEAHWLLWLGVLATLAVAVVAARRPDLAPLERRGYLFVLASGLAYPASPSGTSSRTPTTTIPSSHMSYLASRRPR